MVKPWKWQWLNFTIFLIELFVIFLFPLLLYYCKPKDHTITYYIQSLIIIKSSVYIQTKDERLSKRSLGRYYWLIDWLEQPHLAFTSFNTQNCSNPRIECLYYNTVIFHAQATGSLRKRLILQLLILLVLLTWKRT